MPLTPPPDNHLQLLMVDHAGSQFIGNVPNPQKHHIVIILAKKNYAPVANLWKAYFCPVFAAFFAVKISRKLIIIVKIGKIAHSAKILGIFELKYLKIDRKWQYIMFILTNCTIILLHRDHLFLHLVLPRLTVIQFFRVPTTTRLTVIGVRD